MMRPELKSYEEQAVDTVTSVLNRAKESLGVRQTLKQLAETRDCLAPPAKVALTALGPPLAITSEKLIAETIEKRWHLTDTFKYHLKYMGGSQDECSQNYYYEACRPPDLKWSLQPIDACIQPQTDHQQLLPEVAIFSQPTPAYPIPQATVSVFFRVQQMYTEANVAPTMIFTVEGHHSQNDVRYVVLTADDILAVLQMKLKLFRRIEEIRLF